jgi:hypothetical protein
MRADQTCVAVFVATLFPACHPKVNSFQMDPHYYCDGDEVHISWDTEGFGTVRLVDKNGNTVMNVDGTKPIEGAVAAGTFKATRTMMPLDLVGKGGTKLGDVAPLIREALLWTANLDNEYWTAPFKWDHIVITPEGTNAQTIPPGLPYSFSRAVTRRVPSEPIGDVVDVPCTVPGFAGPVEIVGKKSVTKYWDTLTAVSWSIQDRAFGSKCKVFEIQNCGEQAVTATIDGETVNLAANGSASLTQEHRRPHSVIFKLVTPITIESEEDTEVAPDDCRGGGTRRLCMNEQGSNPECAQVRSLGCMKLHVRCDLP